MNSSNYTFFVSLVCGVFIWDNHGVKKTNYCALKTYGEIRGELLDGPWYDLGGKALMGGKGAKGRRSVLNVTQPRRKAKLQLVQSAPYRRRSEVHYCRPYDIATTQES